MLGPTSAVGIGQPAVTIACTTDSWTSFLRSSSCFTMTSRECRKHLKTTRSNDTRQRVFCRMKIDIFCTRIAYVCSFFYAELFSKIICSRFESLIDSLRMSNLQFARRDANHRLIVDDELFELMIRNSREFVLLFSSILMRSLRNGRHRKHFRVLAARRFSHRLWKTKKKKKAENDRNSFDCRWLCAFSFSFCESTSWYRARANDRRFNSVSFQFFASNSIRAIDFWSNRKRLQLNCLAFGLVQPSTPSLSNAQLQGYFSFFSKRQKKWAKMCKNYRWLVVFFFLFLHLPLMQLSFVSLFWSRAM